MFLFNSKTMGATLNHASRFAFPIALVCSTIAVQADEIKPEDPFMLPFFGKGEGSTSEKHSSSTQSDILKGTKDTNLGDYCDHALPNS